MAGSVASGAPPQGRCGWCDANEKVACSLSRKLGELTEQFERMKAAAGGDAGLLLLPGTGGGGGGGGGGREKQPHVVQAAPCVECTAKEQAVLAHAHTAATRAQQVAALTDEVQRLKGELQLSQAPKHEEQQIMAELVAQVRTANGERDQARASAEEVAAKLERAQQQLQAHAQQAQEAQRALRQQQAQQQAQQLKEQHTAQQAQRDAIEQAQLVVQEAQEARARAERDLAGVKAELETERQTTASLREAVRSLQQDGVDFNSAEMKVKDETIATLRLRVNQECANADAARRDYQNALRQVQQTRLHDQKMLRQAKQRAADLERLMKNDIDHLERVNEVCVCMCAWLRRPKDMML